MEWIQKIMESESKPITTPSLQLECSWILKYMKDDKEIKDGQGNLSGKATD
jgi:hypothetical protein